jgi:hypothetical protein
MDSQLPEKKRFAAILIKAGTKISVPSVEGADFGFRIAYTIFIISITLQPDAKIIIYNVFVGHFI